MEPQSIERQSVRVRALRGLPVLTFTVLVALLTAIVLTPCMGEPGRPVPISWTAVAGAM